MVDILWTGNGGDSSWSNPANWDTNNVPTAADNVTIDSFASVTLDTNATVASLNLNGGATLTNSGELNVTTVNWTQGTFAGTGTINIPATTGTLNISGTDFKSLNTTLNNLGTANWSGTGGISNFEGTFNNSGQFNIQNSQNFDAVFNNTGTVTKSAGNADASFGNNFTNTGTVDIQVGTVSLLGNFFGGTNTNSGTFNVAEGATLEVSSGTLTLNPGTTFTGTGLVRQTGGTIALETLPATPVNIINFTQDGGTLNGGGSLNITGNFNWTGGTQEGAGSTTLAAGAISSISGTDQKSLFERTFNNQGTLTWTGTGDISTGSGGAFNNSGTFEIQNSQVFFADFDGFTFNNTGTLTKSAGTGDTDFDNTSFNNTGTVNVQTGTFIVGDGDGSSTGTFNTADATIVEFNGGTNTINDGAIFTGTGLVQLTGGTLNVETAADSAVAIANFEQTGGTLSGTGNLQVAAPTPAEGETPQTSSFTWSGGTQSGTGTTTIGAGTTGSISGTETKNLTQRTFNNESTITWTGTGNISAQDGATFNNTGTLDIQNSQSFFGDFDGSTSFNNTGTVTKSAGTGATDFEENVFNNTGTVNVQTGTLVVGDGGGSSTGTYNTADGATLEFADNNFSAASHTLNDGATFAGPGLVQLTGGTLNVETAADSAVAIANFEQTGGTLSGAGNLRVAAPIPAEGETPQTSSFTWSGGTQSGTGTTTIGAGTTGSISGTDQKSLTERTFNNESTITWTGTGNISAQDGATFNNTGTLDIQNSQSFFGDFDGSTSFNNNGTLTKSVGTGATDFDENVFNNTGTVNVQTGTLVVGDGGGSSTGAYNIADGAILEFGEIFSFSGSHTLNEGTTFGGPGLVQLTGGTLNVETAADSQIAIPNLEQTGGTLSGAGNLRVAAPTPAEGETPQSSSFTWSGGTQSGTGTTTIVAGTTGSISSTDQKTLTERTFSNESTITWTGTGNISAQDGAIFNNAGTFDVQNSQSFFGDFDGSTSFNNSGTVTKTVGTGATDFGNNIFNNTGTVDAQIGSITLGNGGTSTGIFNTAEAAVVEFDGGTHNLNQGVAFTGAGTTRVSGGTFSVGSATTDIINAVNFEQSSGTVDGPGNFTTTGTFDWSGGTQGGVGRTTIGATGTLNITGNDFSFQTIDERTIDNNGTTNWSGTGDIFATNAAIFNNNGTFNISNNATYDADFFSDAEQFNNAGSVIKTSPGDTEFTDVAFTNSGTIEAQAGNLSVVRETFISDGGTTVTGVNGTIDLTETEVIAPNQPPTLDVNEPLIIEDGTALPILNTNLQITDVEDTPEEITYTVVTLPTVGSLLLNGTALAVGDTFTQANINGSQLLYQNNDGGGDVSDSFVFTASDGEDGVIGETTFNITVEPPVNDPPVLSINGGVSLDDGTNVAISSAVLTVTDPDNAPGELTYTVTELPSNGQLLLNGTALAANGTFTQANINDSLLTYANTAGGDETADNFTFTVSDGAGGEIGATPFNITVNQPPPNQPPVLAPIPAVSLDDGANVIISEAVLEVTDPDNAPGELTYTVTELPSEGDLLLDGTELEVNDTFTQADINADLLTYANTEGGDETSDNFTFTVSDGAGGEIGATGFNITVNQPATPPVEPPPVNEDPVLATNTGVSLDDGDNVTISNAVLAVTDTDNAPGELTYTVTDLPTEGDLLLDGTELEVNDTFTQANINAGLLTYANTEGGDETSDNFTFTVSDGEGGEIAATAFNIGVSQAINGTNGVDELSGDSDSDIINGLGGNDDIRGLGGNDTLRGGAGNDELLGNLGNDRIVGDDGNDTNIGGIGNDFLLGVDDDDVLIGGPGNDIMLGGSGDDILEGRPGRDRMNGGLGADTMTGGVSRDLFIFNTNEAFSTEIGVDTIVDFTPGQDLILLDRTTFVGLTAVDSGINASEFEVVTTNADAATSNALITYNSTTGALFYNQNGSAGGFGNGAQFALLENTPVLEAADFKVR